MAAARPSGRLRRLWRVGLLLALAGVALDLATPLSVPVGSSSPQTATATFSSTGQTRTFTVPAGVSTLTFTPAGEAGGAGTGTSAQAAGGAGGDGAVVTGILSVTPGEQLTIDVGQAGSPASTSLDSQGQYPTGGGGANPDAAWDGGTGGIGSQFGPTPGGSGGGGGAATVILEGTTPLLVAGGGGGGGGASGGGGGGPGSDFFGGGGGGSGANSYSASAISGGAFTATNTGNGFVQFSWSVDASLAGSASPTPAYAATTARSP
jgi:hypothetical protein